MSQISDEDRAFARALKAGLEEIRLDGGVSMEAVGRAFPEPKCRIWARQRFDLGGDANFQTYHFPALARALGDGAIDVLAHLLGGYFVREEQVASSDGELVAESGALMVETGEAVGEIAEALPNGITEGEARRIVKQLRDVRQACARIEAKVKASIVRRPAPARKAA